MFEPNAGQAPAGVRFLSRGHDYTLALGSGGVQMHLRSRTRESQLKLRFVGANQQAAVEGDELLPGVTNIFKGNDARQWRTSVPNYSRVVYRELYSGIDLVFYGNGRELEYDFVVKPGARPERIRLAFHGQSGLQVNAAGDLVLSLNGAEIVQRRPRVYQDSTAGRVEIASSYELRSPGEAGIRLANWDRSRKLVIDPVLNYATYWGGNADETPPEIAVDSSGNVFLFGDTQSINFPTSQGALRTQRPGGPWDSYVTKFSPEGRMVWSTLLGGTGEETAIGIKVDATGSIYLLGSTNSGDFPVTAGVIQSTKAVGGTAGTDAFITKLNVNGNALVYSTYLGGNATDSPVGIDVNSAGEAFVAGFTLATNFPTTTGSLKPRSTALLYEGFVSRLDATATRLIYSTYISGSIGELIGGIAVDAQSNAYLVGATFSPDFPISQGAFQTAFKGLADLFVMKLNPQGSSVIYSTLVGGSTDLDTPIDIAVDTVGNAHVIAFADSPDFPVTQGSIQPGRQGTTDPVVFKVNQTGTGLVYATYFGGTGTDSANTIALDSLGAAVILLTTTSSGLPTPQAFRTAPSGQDLYVAKLSTDGRSVQQASYLGGSSGDAGGGMAIDNRDRVYVAGMTLSTNLATTGAAQATSGGAIDAFWARMDFAAPTVTLTASPDRISATGAAGATIAKQQISLVAAAGARPDWNLDVTTQSGGLWLEVSPVSGSGSATIDVNFRTTGLAAGTYNGTITLVNRTANTRTPIPVVLTITPAAPSGGQLTSAGVLSAASFQGGNVSPGLIVTIFGQRIGPDPLVSATVGSDLKFPTTLSETRVLFDGVAAPLIYVSAGQISAIVPYAVAARQTTELVVEYRGVRSNAVSVPVVAAKPGLFTANASGSGPGAIRNQDLSVNSSSNPAQRQSIVVLYATGEGVTDPDGVDGLVAANVFPKPKQPVRVRIGGVDAEILYAGAAPSLVAGVLQVNARVPANVPDGNVPVQLLVGNAESPTGVTVAILGDAQ